MDDSKIDPLSCAAITETILSFAKDCYKRNTDAGYMITPTWFVFDKEGKYDVIATPFEGPDYERVNQCKEMACTMIAAVIKSRGAVSYAFLSEAWTVTTTRNLSGVDLSKRDDRVEAVVIEAVVDGGERKLTTIPIDRGDDGVPRPAYDKTVCMDGNGPDVELRGRMSSLFTREVPDDVVAVVGRIIGEKSAQATVH